MEGRVQGNFYTDAWPHFTTVVFQCVEPRLSETADLLCYSTSKHDLLHVLQQNQLVTGGKWQMIQIIEDDNKTIGECVIKNLNIDGRGLSSQDYFVFVLEMYSFLGQPNLPDVPCPRGYFLGTLMEKHNQLATSQGQWFNNVGRPANVAKEYHKQSFQKLGSIAAYHNQDPTVPASWTMQWAIDSTIGNLFTVEAHRRQGLAEAILVGMCKRILAKGDFPECRVLEENVISKNLCHKVGFSSIGKAIFIFLHF